MNQAWKVFLACVIGAGIGSLIALEVNRFFWWIGPIVGGLVGYLAYEWREVVRAVGAAFEAVSGWRPPKPNTGRIRLYFATVMNGEVMVLLLLFFGLPFVVALYIIPSPVLSIKDELLLAFWTGVVTWGLTQIGVLGVSYEEVEAVPDSMVKKRARVLGKLWKRRMAMLPRAIILCWWMLVKVIAKVVAKSCRLTCRFGWELFIRIHSEMRLLCGTDAMLGAIVGYFAGSAIIGAVTGGLLGVANYALVTERWLRPRGYLPAN